MRMPVISSLLVLAAATPVRAQAIQFQVDELRAQQQAADRRFIDQSNQLQALDARLRADQAVADLTAQRSGVYVPQISYIAPVASGAVVVLQRYPTMSDAALAASNQRVHDAARNRR